MKLQLRQKDSGGMTGATSSRETSIPDVRKTIVVPATPERAYELFVSHPLDWWPPTHVLVKGRRTEMSFGRHPGEPYFERDAEGNTEIWGHMLEVSPAQRLLFTWQINGRWQAITDQSKSSRIEVTFAPTSDRSGTTVELAHIELDRHGADGQFIFNALQGPSPGETLQRFHDFVAAHRPFSMSTSSDGDPT